MFISDYKRNSGFLGFSFLIYFAFLILFVNYIFLVSIDDVVLTYVSDTNTHSRDYLNSFLSYY